MKHLVIWLLCLLVVSSRLVAYPSTDFSPVDRLAQNVPLFACQSIESIVTYGKNNTQIFNQGVDVKQHKFRIRVLLLNAINFQRQIQIMWVWDFILCYYDWSHRSEGVLSFRNNPLPGTTAITCRNIIDDGVAKNLIECRFFGNIFTFFANDNSQFNFPI